MTSRFIQIIARVIGIALTIAAGWIGAEESQYAETIADLSASLAAAVLAALAFLVDLVIHRVETGGFMKPPGKSNPKTAGQIMKSVRRVGMLAVLLALIPAMGCSTDPSQRWVETSIGLRLTADAVNSAYDAGELSDEDLLALWPYFETAKTAVDEAFGLLPEGRAPFDGLMSTARLYMDKLREKAQEAKDEPGKADSDSGPGDEGERGSARGNDIAWSGSSREAGRGEGAT